jgi:hypothetical protein
MGIVLVICGLGWALIGGAHLIRLSTLTGANAPSDGMAAFGQLLDVVVFIGPGLILAVVGAMVWRRAKRSKNAAASAP